MTSKVSLDKNKIKFVLLEGVHQSALDTLHAAGYTNIDYYKKALDGDELKEAIKDAHFIGLRSRTHLTEEMIAAAPKLIAIGCFCSCGFTRSAWQKIRDRGLRSYRFTTEYYC